jgi:hypothetical protein
LPSHGQHHNHLHLRLAILNHLGRRGYQKPSHNWPSCGPCSPTGYRGKKIRTKRKFWHHLSKNRTYLVVCPIFAETEMNQHFGKILTTRISNPCKQKYAAPLCKIRIQHMCKLHITYMHTHTARPLCPRRHITFAYKLTVHAHTPELDRRRPHTKHILPIACSPITLRYRYELERDCWMRKKVKIKKIRFNNSICWTSMRV